jgi:hypothetical protein
LSHIARMAVFAKFTRSLVAKKDEGQGKPGHVIPERRLACYFTSLTPVTASRFL